MITCPFIPIASNLSSHRAAQGVVYAAMLREAGHDVTINWSGKLSDHNEFDRVYVYHGNDNPGGLNMYGGVVEYPYQWNVANFFKFKGEVVSLGIEMPRYDVMLKEKIDNTLAKEKIVQKEFLELDWDNVTRICTRAGHLRFPNIADHLVVGDSHSICMYRPGWTVHSIPYKTLHGALAIGLDMLVSEVDLTRPFKKIEFYFGNIDLRHHIFRQPDPYAAATDLVTEYVKQALYVSELCGCQVGIYELLPIENEARKIPKTGWFDGTPFKGSWSERDEMRTFIRDRILQEISKYSVSSVYLIDWVSYLQNLNGELDFKFMEFPRSVHLSREYYPHWIGDEGPDYRKMMRQKINTVKEPDAGDSNLSEFF